MFIEPESTPPACPVLLHGREREIWTALARRLVARRIYSVLDECALEILCTSFAHYLEAFDQLAAVDCHPEALRPNFRAALEEIVAHAHRRTRELAAQFYLVHPQRRAIYPVDDAGRDAELMALLAGDGGAAGCQSA